MHDTINRVPVCIPITGVANWTGDRLPPGRWFQVANQGATAVTMRFRYGGNVTGTILTIAAGSISGILPHPGPDAYVQLAGTAQGGGGTGPFSGCASIFVISE
jgi:hypothetical protein